LAYLTGQPVLILKEGTERSRDRDARRSNMMAAQIARARAPRRWGYA
jgi:hypothetical protein